MIYDFVWGIFEVFAGTIIVCTLTALTVLTSGLVDLSTGAAFIAIAILLFAFPDVQAEQEGMND